MVRIFTYAIVACMFITPLWGLRGRDLRAIQAHSLRGDANQHLCVGCPSSSVQLIQRHATSQPSDVTVSTTHENFFQRMGSALMGFVVGILLIVFSIPVLWLNEKRNAKQEALITQGESDCRSISADDYDSKNTHWLVHVNGNTVSTKPVEDPQFNVVFESGVVRLSSSVQIFQYKEEERTETKEKETLGGGKTTETRKWKEYTREWLPTFDSGENFAKAEYRNSKPAGIEPGSHSQTCERVEFGKGFLLGEAELSQLSGDSRASVGKLLCTTNTTLKFLPGCEHDGWYYCCKNNERAPHMEKGNMCSPHIGDVRVRFTSLKDGPATVVGLQTSSTEHSRGGFLPYRVIRRPPCPCWGLSEDQQKQRLFEEASRNKQKINEEDMWQGIMWCCCCACNLIQSLFGGVMMPEILDVFGEPLSKATAFKLIREKAAATKWTCRTVGWLLMFSGLYLTFLPFTTFLKILPFGLGSFLSSVGSGIVFIFSFITTLLVSSLIIALAYSAYHPTLGIMAVLAIAAVAGATLALSSVTHTKSA